MARNQFAGASDGVMRANWSQAFVDMAKNKDDTLLDSDAQSATEWDRGEWRW
jgi:hypothetical protein